MSALAEYQELKKKLDEVKKTNPDPDSPEQERILEQMDVVWYRMTPEERTELNRK